MITKTKTNGLIIVDEMFHIWATYASEAIVLLTNGNLLGPRHPCGGRELPDPLITLEELEGQATTRDTIIEKSREDQVRSASITIQPCCNTYVLMLPKELEDTPEGSLLETMNKMGLFDLPEERTASRYLVNEYRLYQSFVRSDEGWWHTCGTFIKCHAETDDRKEAWLIAQELPPSTDASRRNTKFKVEREPGKDFPEQKHPYW